MIMNGVLQNRYLNFMSTFFQCESWNLECINTPHTTRLLVQQLKTELFLRVAFYFVIPSGRLSFIII